MGQNNIDQYFQDALAQHESPIDSAMLWDGIQEKTKTRQKFIWLTAAAVLLGLSLSALYFYKSSTRSIRVVQEFKNQNETDITESTGLNVIETSKITAVNEDNQRVNNLKVTARKSESESSNVYISDQHEQAQVETQVQVQVQSQVEVSQTETSFNTKFSQDIISPSNSAIEKADPIIQSEILEGQAVAASISNKNILNLDPIPNIDPLLSSGLVENKIALGRGTTECPTFGNKKQNLFVQAYSFIDYVDNRMSANLDNQSYLDARINSQSYRPSGRVGVQLKWQHDSGLYIKGGLEYAQVREKFRHRTETTTTEIRPNQLINLHIDMNGDTIRTYGNAPVTTIETKNWRVKNSYKSFDIPVFIGYQLDNNDWYYGIEAGVIYNLKFDFAGMLLDPTDTPVEPVNYFQNSTHLSLTAGLVLGKRLNSRSSVFTSLQWKSNLSDINNNINNPITQKFRTIGLGVGLEYKI